MLKSYYIYKDLDLVELYLQRYRSHHVHHVLGGHEFREISHPRDIRGGERRAVITSLLERFREIKRREGEG